MMEALGGGAWMEEGDHWRHALKDVYCPTPSSQGE